MGITILFLLLVVLQQRFYTKRFETLFSSIKGFIEDMLAAHGVLISQDILNAGISQLLAGDYQEKKFAHAGMIVSVRPLDVVKKEIVAVEHKIEQLADLVKKNPHANWSWADSYLNNTYSVILRDSYNNIIYNYDSQVAYEVLSTGQAVNGIFVNEQLIGVSYIYHTKE